jgi:hypothetical protein
MPKGNCLIELKEITGGNRFLKFGGTIYKSGMLSFNFFFNQLQIHVSHLKSGGDGKSPPDRSLKC